MNRQTWSIHNVDYDSAMKRNAILTHAKTWMTLKDAEWEKPDTKDTKGHIATVPFL
jgi:hypothetical protein